MRQVFVAAWLVAGCAVAQDMGGDMGGYTSMSIDAGRFVGSFSGGMAIKEMTDGVRITLLSEDKNMKPVPIRAYKMKFDYKEGATRPSAITMEGNVEVQHPQGTITAEKAEWNFDTGLLVFSGNPVMSGEQVKEMSGSKFTMNFKTGEVEVTDMRVKEYPFNTPGASGGTGDPSLLTQGDVKEWAGFLKTLKDQAAGEAASPGKQIAKQLDGEMRRMLLNVSVEALAEEKGTMVKQLNKVLKKDALYSEAAWKGVTLSEEAKGLLAKEGRKPEETTRLNRLLLEAAYPDYIAKR
ncbi:MAG TPA: hypothetical protein PLI09_01320 [Candidatus Hydrogenedentes bacterium]|nr:hypothetical protein [Candidatus Hydrogenedentota bacterium]